MSEGLKSPDRHERSRAVDALGKSKDHASAVRALVAVLRQDPDRGVRTAALEAIETSRDPSAIPGLINLFRLNRGQDDVVAQIGASHALRKIGAPCVPQLLQALSDPSAWVRRAVVEVLGEVGNPEVADRIAGLQADPSPVVRLAVEHALAKLKGKPEPTTP
jgi:HEAT repeat protein